MDLPKENIGVEGIPSHTVPKLSPCLTPDEQLNSDLDYKILDQQIEVGRSIVQNIGKIRI